MAEMVDADAELEALGGAPRFLGARVLQPGIENERVADRSCRQQRGRAGPHALQIAQVANG